VKYYLIGCGGIGGWLALALVKMLSSEDELVLMDGDKFEEKNLDRQMCSKRDIGKSKARCLRGTLAAGARCKISILEEYLGEDVDFAFSSDSWVLTGVDNHPARLRTLNLCDNVGVPCISAANGYEDAEAFMYSPKWSDTPMDPRKYYPELLDDVQGDPLAPPCTGEVLESTPQLAMANMCAAAHAMQLLWFWKEVAPKLQSIEAREVSPVQIIGTASRIRVKTVKDLTDETN